MTLDPLDAPSPRERPLRADAAQNRQRILEAAREVFAQRGLDVGLDEIAAYAGVGTGTAYRRFPDKKALVTALFNDRIADMVDVARSAASHPDAWQGLITLIDKLAAMQIEDRGLHDLVLTYVDGPTLTQLRIIEHCFDDLSRRAIAAGDLRPDAGGTDFSAILIMIAHFGALTTAADPDLWRRYLRIYLDGLTTRHDPRIPLTPPTPTPETIEAARRPRQGNEKGDTRTQSG